MDRTDRYKMAEATRRIIAAGGYTAPSGEYRDLMPMMREAKRYSDAPNMAELATLPARVKYTPCFTQFRVSPESTLDAARRINDETGHEALCLVFASAKNPGGGWLTGASGQEEHIARRTTLDAVYQRYLDLYQDQKRNKAPYYSDVLFIARGVPVIRDDDGGLLERPFKASFVVSPAVNMTCVHNPRQAAQAKQIMQHRAERILALAADRGYRHIVLGAWGCGVFQNAPRDVARYFATHLREKGTFTNAFESVTYAMGAADTPTYEAFTRYT